MLAGWFRHPVIGSNLGQASPGSESGQCNIELDLEIVGIAALKGSEPMKKTVTALVALMILASCGGGDSETGPTAEERADAQVFWASLDQVPKDNLCDELRSNPSRLDYALVDVFGQSPGVAQVLTEILMSSCPARVAAPGADPSRPSQSGSGRSSVTYRWTGTASSVSYTIRNAQGNTEQATGKPNNNQLSIGEVDPGEFLYISVQNTSDTGSVSCKILEDGEIISSATSTGAYVIASCDASSGE